MNIAIIKNQICGYCHEHVLCNIRKPWCVCVDVDKSKIRQLNEGQLFLHKLGLLPLFKQTPKEKCISFTNKSTVPVGTANLVEEK